MSSPDIRWIQRFDNFKRAFARLSEASELVTWGQSFRIDFLVIVMSLCSMLVDSSQQLIHFFQPILVFPPSGNQATDGCRTSHGKAL